MEHFKIGVEELFGIYPDVQLGYHSVYFPAEFRNPIMAAGRAQTLLRLTYSGVAREVEPYSLVYKQARGKPAREYLYAYDRTGGTSGVASIKSFVHERIQRLEGTSETFEPRFPIELAKAGERSDKSFFGQPFTATGPTRRRRLRLRRFPDSGIRYVVQCRICDKQFKHRRNASRLRKHKDRYGNQCIGRSGFYVETLYP